MTDSKKLDLLLEQFEVMQVNMNKMHDELADNKKVLEGLQRDITDIRRTLENEANKNIVHIAEGNLNLSHKLDGSIKSRVENEVLVIRVNILENELRRLKDKVDQIA